MELEINISKKQIFLLVGILSVFSILFVLAYGNNISDDNKPYHPLYRLARCPIQSLCGGSWDQRSVDQNSNGLIDQAESASSCGSITNSLTMTYSTRADSYTKRSTESVNLGVHKICFLHDIIHSLPGGSSCYSGTVGCGLSYTQTANGPSWTLTSYYGMAGSQCNAFCLG